MALTVDDRGRITVPSGSSLPSDLSRMIAERLSQKGTGGTGGTSLTISLDGTPVTEPIRLRRSTHVVPGNGQTFTSIESAINSWYLLQDQYRDALQRKMWFLGLIDGPNNMAQASKVWAVAVEQAWNFRAAGRDANPVDMLKRMTSLRAGQLGPNAPRSTTQRQINFTDPAQAKVWIRQAFQESMGRDPHPAEIRTLLQAIAAGNKKHPQVAKTTVDPDGNQTTRVVDPGFDPTAYIANQLAADPEARAAQAAATLYPALIAALASPV